MSEVEAVNGADVKLRCTFISSYPVSLKSVSVTWSFQPLLPGPRESVCCTGCFVIMFLLCFSDIYQVLQGLKIYSLLSENKTVE